MKIRRILVIVIGITQGVIGILGGIFACMFHFNFLNIQTIPTIFVDFLPFSLFILILFSLFSIISGFSLINEGLE